MRPGLVVFDMDGVLVDSERIANRIFHACLAEHGVPLTLEQTTRRYVGRSMAFAVADIDKSFGIVLPPDFAETERAKVLAAYEGELQAVEGVPELLEGLDLPFCLASSSDPPRIKRSLELCGLLGFFEGHCFSATQVANGKPAPDLFLFAAEQMGFAAADCVVVEDTLAGLAAAKAAGMKAYAYAGAGHTDRGELAATGAVVIDRMAELAKVLRAD
ncbi:MAG: HAD-IA family hydrolase [Magnetospirillum sp.]|nr:HAD-IA family hydrolase [Magnetospirillum sp.]